MKDLYQKYRTLFYKHFYSFKLFDVPFYLHWSVFLAFAICLPLSFVAGIELLVCLFALLSLLMVHEIGHALVVNHQNLKINRISLSIIIGRCHYDLPYYKHQDIFIAWGGVLAQLILFIPSFIWYQVTDVSNNGIMNVLFAFYVVFNPFFILVNLLPIKGADGYLAWQIFPYIIDNLRNKRTIRNRKQTHPLNKKTAADITNEIMDELRKKI